MIAQRTVYCGKRHRTSDGVPIDHPCRILLPAFLEAERRERYELAAEVLEAMPIVLHPGVALPGEELDARWSGGPDAAAALFAPGARQRPARTSRERGENVVAVTRRGVTSGS